MTLAEELKKEFQDYCKSLGGNFLFIPSNPYIFDQTFICASISKPPEPDKVIEFLKKGTDVLRRTPRDLRINFKFLGNSSKNTLSFDLSGEVERPGRRSIGYSVTFDERFWKEDIPNWQEIFEKFRQRVEEMTPVLDETRGLWRSSCRASIDEVLEGQVNFTCFINPVISQTKENVERLHKLLDKFHEIWSADVKL